VLQSLKMLLALLLNATNNGAATKRAARGTGMGVYWLTSLNLVVPGRMAVERAEIVGRGLAQLETVESMSAFVLAATEYGAEGVHRTR
jgi:hypothetical protein